MKIAEYVENFSEAPLLLEDLAQAALNVEDDPAFIDHARAYLDALKTFESVLADRYVERG